MKYFLNLIRFIKFQIKRLKHLKDYPHEFALGFACGAWTNFNPFFGINIFIGMGLAFVFRAFIIASVLGVLITGLAFVFPFFSCSGYPPPLKKLQNVTFQWGDTPMRKRWGDPVFFELMYEAPRTPGR